MIALDAAASGLAEGPLALHLKAERALRDLVRTGKAGDLLPTETDLALRWGVSRTTIRQAMSRLVAAGLIARTAGRGTEILNRDIEAQLDFTPFAHALMAGGHEVETPSAELIRRPATAIEAEVLGIRPGHEVEELRRVRSVDAEPFALLCTVLGRGMSFPSDLSGSLYEALERTGVHLVRLADTLAAVPADRTVSRALGVPLGAPVLRIQRTAYDSVGEPVELTRTYLRANAGYVVEHKR